MLNRFIQPDTIIPHPYNSQSYNRYSYVHNNPIIYNDPTGHEVCDTEGWCGFDTINNRLQNGGNPNRGIFIPDSADVEEAISDNYEASYNRGVEFVNGLLNHEGWWSRYLSSGDFDVAWKFLIAFAFLWESYSYKNANDWDDFSKLMTESIINKAGEFYAKYGIAGLYVYIGGREALFKSRGNMSESDPRWVKGSSSYLNTWDLQYLGANSVWETAQSEIDSSWTSITNWTGTVGEGAWDYGVIPPMTVDSTKVVWKGETFKGTVNPMTGKVEPFYIVFISK